MTRAVQDLVPQQLVPFILNEDDFTPDRQLVSSPEETWILVEKRTSQRCLAKKPRMSKLNQAQLTRFF
jgi:hypothetical protein